MDGNVSRCLAWSVSSPTPSPSMTGTHDSLSCGCNTIIPTLAPSTHSRWQTAVALGRSTVTLPQLLHLNTRHLAMPTQVEGAFTPPASHSTICNQLSVTQERDSCISRKCAACLTTHQLCIHCDIRGPRREP